MIKQMCLALTVAMLGASVARANLDLSLSGGDLGGTIQIDLQGDPGELYLLFVSDDPNNLIKWSSITINTPGFIASLDASGQASVSLPLPSTRLLHGLQLYFNAVTVTGPPFVVDDTSPVCTIALALKHSFVTSVGTPTSPRTDARMTELADGRVLITGGGGGTIFQPLSVDTAEIYDPCTDTFTATAGNMSVPRSFHAETLMQDGRVLITGGADAALNINASAEIFDPATGQFTSTASPMSRPRIGHTAIALGNRFVWVVGGSDTLLPDYLAFLLGMTNTTELYDRLTDQWVPGPNLDRGVRGFHTQTVLESGKILIVGGYTIIDVFGSPVAEISNDAIVFDPQTGTFVLNTLRNMAFNRVGHSAVRLDDGRVLLGGGATIPTESAPTTAATDIYDPATDSFVSTGFTPMTTARGLFPMFKLNDGRVLAAGGVAGDFLNISATSFAEIYDPVLDQWTATTTPLSVPRASAAGIPLSNGRFLIVGGSDQTETPQVSAELFVQ